MTAMTLGVGLCVLLLAYSNGANDNFKGVATLWGSGAASFRGALAWATATTIAGSLAAVLLAGELAEKFKGRDLIPPELLASPELALAVAGAAALTILLATMLGMPTSTTHALVGALLGAAFIATRQVNAQAAATSFFAPLLVSPFLAVGLVAALYPALRWSRRRIGLSGNSCVCLGEIEQETTVAPVAAIASTAATRTTTALMVDTQEACAARYDGHASGVSVTRAIDAAHYLSSGAVCFSRALNDTPKIAALLMVTGATLSLPVVAMVTAAMAAGGLLQSRKVAQTMSQKITKLSAGQGLTANAATAAIVLGASHLGLPVSTTHVSCGAIFGIGVFTGRIQRRVIVQILLAWLFTLPTGALLGAGLYFALAGAGN